MVTREIFEPWNSFLKEIDESIDTEVPFHCFGAFAIKMLFGLPRETSDIDIVSAVSIERFGELDAKAGKGSLLHEKYKVYLDLVGTIAVLPDSYEDRLIPIESASLNRIRLYAMEPHDIVLAKI
jgi:hypothetical protein